MSSAKRPTVQDVRARHLRTLRLLSVLGLSLAILLAFAASHLPLFDSSPLLLVSPEEGLLAKGTSSLLRWDTFHFAHIAQEGYVYEYEWAFFPGTPFVMRAFGELLRRLRADSKLTIAHLLAGGGLASLLCGTTTTLYDLTMHCFNSPSVAYLTCLLSLLPSSPATLRFSASTEPFFTYFSYRGMLCCARSEWLHASLFFAVASTFRSNGFMLGGYILWGLFVGPFFGRQSASRISLYRLTKAGFLTSLVFTPFLYHQYNAYLTFCAGENVGDTPPWCSSTLPFIYSYVQEKYWNVGFLRYWTPSQAPNILLATPVLGVLLTFCVKHTLNTTIPLILSHPLFSPLSRLFPASLRIARSTPSFLSNKDIVPHALHALVLGLVLLFAAHTQIALRLAASLPTTYWAAAWLVVEHPRAGKWWVAWSVVWGAISIVLWAVFLPPA
ncbi:glycosyltransferase family 76 protein [Phanerochaete carnosa HHB-10118-sp]|uniref:GPI mannosyltransferase 2 n=1 Tax=Phanerochaete carnosa (strain HHB-10118-sp) TaxID=650164 RepID=K5UVI4_PHACS|nr:glycosyltransferase family 76 protein [Phanerochaete carnosa HHB-10118-sp]EKM54036.1 glycosyltransferase family 76 protein [Phanerochaete carnosa HHB-10118-sp]